MRVDRPLEYLGREYQLVRDYGKKGVKTRMSKKYLKSCSAVLGMENAKPSKICGRKVNKEWDLAIKEDPEPHKVKLMQSGVGKLQF